MKKIIKYVLTVFIAGTFLNSCETTDLDLQVSPNDLAADQADPNLLLNSIQLAYGSSIQTFNNRGAELTRIDYMSGRNYFQRYPGNTFNGVWERLYSSGSNFIGSGVDVGIFTNVSTLIDIDAASDTDYSFHIAVGQTLKAHMLLLTVDYIGEAVFSEANNPVEFPAPNLDTGASVYASAISLLDEAAALMAAGPSDQGATDFFYGGNTGRWIKLINTLKMKAAVTTGDTATFTALSANADNYISSAADDFQWQFGTNENAPDNRHPDFGTNYTSTGAQGYRNLWLMGKMLNSSDPRRQYYFYRQNATTPGADDSDGPNEETLVCSLATPPAHYDGFDYCFLEQGYWGRAHGNNEGGPPDNFLKTAAGVYPAGGKFDDSSFGNVGLGEGGAGAGVEPIILSSYVEFWKGQNALASGGDATAFLRAGVEQSIAKVQGFGSLDGDADLSTAPTDGEVTIFVDNVMADYAAATGDDKMNVFSEQYWVAMYGGGSESYNYYRKTGFPTTLAPNWELDPGSFPRSFLYPQSEVITNTNLTQRADMNTQVFWDTNPAGPAFPSAN